MNTVVFDIGGIVSYPGFARNIVRPLEKKGVGIFFWTFLHREHARKLLLDTRLESYWYKIVDMADTWTLQDQARRKDWAGLANYLHTQEDLKDIAQKPSVEQVTQQGPRWLKAMDDVNYGLPLKFPPLIVPGNSLLVESDEPVYVRENSTLYFSHEQNLLAARQYGYSCITVPEHPYIWQHLKPHQTPEDIRRQLKDKLLSWEGNRLISDLGAESGIYREHLHTGPERR